MTPDKDGEFLDTNAALAAHTLLQSAPPQLAMDTEFVRERTYYPRLCLIQAAAESTTVLIDATRIDEFDALNASLLNPATLKILHSAGQDFEALHTSLHLVPAPVFDTQIAAALLGFDDQTSYGALVKQLLDVGLPKTETRTDWCRRPLTAAQLAYAADDVRYLPAIFESLNERLKKAGRLEWLREEVESLAQSVTRPRDAAELLQRVTGQRGLDALQRTVVREIAVWREAAARHRDRPRKWIFADEAIADIARRSTNNDAPLDGMTLPAHIDEAARLDLVHAIDRALATPAEERASSSDAEALDSSERQQLGRLQDAVQSQARRLGVAPARLASRRDLEQLIKGKPNVPQLRGWRRDVIGDALLGLLGSNQDAGNR